MPEAVVGTDLTLKLLRETVKNNKPSGASQTSPTGARLLNMMKSIGWGGNRALSTEEIIQISAVLICLDVLSQDIAKTTFRLKRRLKGGGSEIVDYDEHPVALLLATRPNPYMTWYEFKIMMMLHLGMVQNAFIAKRMRGDAVEELILCMPARTQVLCVDPDNDSAGRGFYCYQVDRFSVHERIQLGGLPNVFLPHEFVHLRGRMFDGQVGYSNLIAGAKTFGMATELLEYSTRLYSNDGGFRGVFQHPGEQGDALSDSAFKHLREQLTELMTQMRRHNVPIVLEEGMTFQQVSMNADQAEASKSKDQAIVDVARTFRIPPHKIMHLINVKYENMETLEKSYVQDTLIPYCRLIEEALGQKLLTPREQLEYFLEFDRREMFLNDQEKLAEVGKVLADRGSLTVDEFRSMFGYNPFGGDAGEARLFPSTYNVVGKENKILIPAGAQPAGDSKGDGAKPEAGKPAKPKPKDAEDEAGNVVEFPSVVGER